MRSSIRQFRLFKSLGVESRVYCKVSNVRVSLYEMAYLGERMRMVWTVGLAHELETQACVESHRLGVFLFSLQS